MTEGGVVLADYDWDTLSRRDLVKLNANAFSMDPSYEPDDDLASLVHSGPAPLTFTFGRNNSGQITTLTASDGNFLSRPSAVQATVYAPNRLNQYSTVGGTAHAYDANGNLTSDGVYSYEYDEENRLRTAVGAGNSASYEYDPLGRRRAKIVTGVINQTLRFASDNAEEIEERDGSNTVLRRYVYGSGIDERIAMTEVSTPANCPGGGRCFYLTNWQGSTTTLVNQNGSLNAVYHYGPYGEGTNWTPADALTGNPFRYTGRRVDPETGLYYYRARYYSPKLGRFLQTDPIGNGDDLNLYTYVGNDPANKTDPTGTKCTKDRTICTADTFRAEKATVDVKHESNMGAAVVANTANFQRPTKQGGEPTGIGMSKGLESGGGGTVTRTDSRPGETSTAQTAALSATNVLGADAVVHGHLGGTVIDEPQANRGYGDTQSLKLGVPTYTVEGHRVGVHDAPNGQLRFQMIKGVMTTTEMQEIQTNLDSEQELFNK